MDEQGAKLPLKAGSQFAFEHGKDGDGKTFAGFQGDIANEAVAYDDIGAVFEQVVAFDVSNEIQVEVFAEFEGLEGQSVAFGVLGADAQNANARIFAAEYFT